MRGLKHRTGLEPWLHDCGDLLPRAKPIAFVVEVKTQPDAELLDRVLLPAGLDQALPLHVGQADDHQAFTVQCSEVAPAGAIEIVAILGSIRVIDHHFGEQAEIAEHRQRHVLQ